jgi:3-deoxy-D-manno-octulosonate 8-phosphate phosphatase (KDO 8-P phosphatase)
VSSLSVSNFSLPADLLERAQSVRLFLMDVDGVLTDGKLFYIPSGDVIAETKGFNSCAGTKFKPV